MLSAQATVLPTAYIWLHASELEAGQPAQVAGSEGMDPVLLHGVASWLAEPAAAGDCLVPDLQAKQGCVADTGGLRGHASVPLPEIDGRLCVAGPDPLAPGNFDFKVLHTAARRIADAISADRRMADLSRGLDELRRSEAGLRAANEQLGLDYRGLLDNMADGVLSIGPDQQIEVLNPVGSFILGVEAENVVGRTLIEAFLDEADNDALIDAVLLPMVEQTERARSTVVYHRRGADGRGEDRQLSVASATYRLRFGAQKGKMGVITAFSDVTEVNALRLAEEGLKLKLQQEHLKLQTAYVTLENATLREKAATRRAQLTGFGAIAAMIVVTGAIGAYTLSPVHSLVPNGSTVITGAIEGGSGTLTIATQPVSSRVAVVGTIDAGSVVNVIGPFDGSIKQVFFQYGGAVERGKPLLKLETADVEVAVRDAESAEIRASQKAAELRDWATGPDMARARRSVSSGELDLASLRSRAAQTKMLLGKGIVAADEYTQLVQQLRAQELQLDAARQDLRTTQDRASGENRRVAEIELANARTKLASLRADLSRAEVLAPVSGVVLSPPSGDSSRRTEMVAPGSRVTKGQAMFAIGGLETMSVRAKVDEIDVNKVRAGRAVEITGDALEGTTLRGIVTSVAAQASGESASRASMAAFPMTVEIQNLTDEQRASLHVGMSANLSIIAYEKQDAIVVPINAVQSGSTGRTVQVRRDGKVESVPVTIGISTPGGVEIRSGLNVGDLIEVP